MDASRISMGRLLNYLFEVTERFGMETRTELILLQRTMVVVEGVSRTLNPHINIWSAARPIVESYIAENIGPRAFLRDIAKTARVLSRFGPRLPELAEAALTREANRAEDRNPPDRAPRWLYVAGGAGLAVLGFVLGRMV
jgi:ubiquinone biosynthesis protein